MGTMTDLLEDLSERDPSAEWEYMLKRTSDQIVEAARRYRETGDERWQVAARAFMDVHRDLHKLRTIAVVEEMEREKGLNATG